MARRTPYSRPQAPSTGFRGSIGSTYVQSSRLSATVPRKSMSVGRSTIPRLVVVALLTLSRLELFTGDIFGAESPSNSNPRGDRISVRPVYGSFYYLAAPRQLQEKQGEKDKETTEASATESGGAQAAGRPKQAA